jgi:lipase chaperone LimK
MDETKDALELFTKKLMRQTNYSEEQCKKFFEENKTLEQFIIEYLNIQEKQEKELSTNQKIFKAIRENF